MGLARLIGGFVRRRLSDKAPVRILSLAQLGGIVPPVATGKWYVEDAGGGHPL